MSPAVHSHNGMQPRCELLDPVSEKKGDFHFLRITWHKHQGCVPPRIRLHNWPHPPDLNTLGEIIEQGRPQM